MGSRFGRRKRRAARAQIAALEDAFQGMQGVNRGLHMLIDKQRRKHAEMRDAFDSWDHRVRRILGSLTALAITPMAPDRVAHRQHLRAQIDSTRGPSFSDTEVLTVRHYFEEMLSLVLSESKDPVALSRHIFVNLRHCDEFERWGSAGYAISETMWNELRRDVLRGDQRAIDFLREDIARQLLECVARDSVKVRPHGISQQR